MSEKGANLSKKQIEFIRKLENPLDICYDSDEYVERGDEDYIVNSVFMLYDSDNDDKIINEDMEDTDTPKFSSEYYDSDR